MAQRFFRLVADDYGLSPGVSRGILALAAKKRLSGTGCMTLFADWQDSARQLTSVSDTFEIGLHLTLTDFPALSTGEKLPGLKDLIVAICRGKISDEAIHAELNAQLDRYTEATGRLPAYLDGHQHVHFLNPVRSWLHMRFADIAPTQRPWVRGAPTLKGAPINIWPKISFIQTIAARFNAQMQAAGMVVHGPLAGFYPWQTSGLFEPSMASLLASISEGAVIMCHPGYVDDTLIARDVLTTSREEELRFLVSDAFADLLQESNRIMTVIPS